MNHISHIAILRSIRPATDRARYLELEVQNGRRFDFQAGQFISVTFERDGGKGPRFYSIASAPRGDNRFEICLNLAPESGVASLLDALKPGDEVHFTGPFGLFTLREPLDPVSAFIATGTGIAPIRAMLQQLYRRPYRGEVWLMVGVRREPDILYRDEFERLARENAGFHFLPVLSRPDPEWTGLRGYVQQHIPRVLSSKDGFHAYVCGQRRMVEDVTRELMKIGYGPFDISAEEFD